MMTINLPALLVLLLGASVATAQTSPEWDNLLPPELPWQGKSERLVAASNDPWITPSESDNFVSTPDYATTRAWLERLVGSSNGFRIERYGTSVLGRELYAVVASQDGATLDPAKPLVLVQAGIHPGEIDGKDAGLMLLRDIAFRGKKVLLDGVNLLFVPILSPDGHENSSRYSRPNQRGPISQGWRATAQNIKTSGTVCLTALGGRTLESLFYAGSRWIDFPGARESSGSLSRCWAGG